MDKNSNTLHSMPCGCPRSTCMILVLFLRIPVHLSKPEKSAKKSSLLTPQLHSCRPGCVRISEMKGWFTPKKNKCCNVQYTYQIQSFSKQKILNVNYPAIEASIFLPGGKRWHGRAGGHEQPPGPNDEMFYHSVWSRVTILLRGDVMMRAQYYGYFFSRMA